MLPKRLLYLLVTAYMFPACIYRQAFYVSPFNARTPSYHTIPVKSDSISSAFYAGAVISAGSANRGGRDNVFCFQSNIGGAHNFTHFQAYYNGNIALGNYKVSKYDSSNNSYSVNYRLINKDAGNKSFFGAGADAGINYVIPLGGGSEWRIIGAQASLQKEFGKYLDYRKQLPDSAATLIIRNDVYATLGGYTEFMINLNDNSSFGLRFAAGKVLGTYNNLNVYDNVIGNKLSYSYTGFTLSYSSGKSTGFLQTNFATKASAFMLGFNYRLVANRK